MNNGWLQGSFLQIVNLTPHDVILRCSDGSQTVLLRSENPARVEVRHFQTGTVMIDGCPIPLVDVTASHVADLPARRPGTGYLVSRMVAEALPGRRDLFFPEDLVRDQDGNVIGCEKLGRPASPEPGRETADA